MNMYYDIGDIKKLRKAHGLTQRQLAKISGLSQSYIAKIEAGKIDPSYSKVQNIFKALESMRQNSVQRGRGTLIRSAITLVKSSAWL